MSIHAFAGFDGFGADPTVPPMPTPDPPSSQSGGDPPSGMLETVDMGAAYLAMGVRGVGGYLVGVALAPSKAQAHTYGLVGAACGGTLGTLALGVFAFICLGKRGR